MRNSKFNNSQFNTEQLRNLIPEIVIDKLGIIIGLSKHNEDCVEFSKNIPIVIETVDEIDDLLEIFFYQDFETEDHLYDEREKYQMLIQTKIIKQKLNLK